MVFTIMNSIEPRQTNCKTNNKNNAKQLKRKFVFYIVLEPQQDKM